MSVLLPSSSLGGLNHHSYTPHEHPCHLMSSLQRLPVSRTAAPVLETLLSALTERASAADAPLFSMPRTRLCPTMTPTRKRPQVTGLPCPNEEACGMQPLRTSQSTRSSPDVRGYISCSEPLSVRQPLRVMTGHPRGLSTRWTDAGPEALPASCQNNHLLMS
jgi:hypothetical protein